MGASKFANWSCTKLRHFFEAKSLNWMVDNLSLEEVFMLERKLAQCSREVSEKISYMFRLAKHAIAKRDGL